MHYANMSVQYTAMFHGCKDGNFQFKFLDCFRIFAKNIDCGYMLESTHRGDSNQYPQSMYSLRAKIRKKIYTRVNPSFSIYKWGVRGCSLHGYVIMMGSLK